jgi:hypothetical protein
MKENIERIVVIGFITSKEVLDQVADIYQPDFLISVSARHVADWCIDYYKSFRKAPESDITGLFFEKSKKLRPEITEGIEDVLADLSDDFSSGEYSTQYLLKRVKEYFLTRKLEVFQEQLKILIDKGNFIEAETLALKFSPLQTSAVESINFSSPEALNRVELAFSESAECLIHYPKQLGLFFNDQLVRGGFVAFLAPEKRGKSFLLMDMVKRAAIQKRKVAFFQAGDMTEAQQLRRFCINICGKSDKEKYCTEHYEPIRDCIQNQMDTCTKEDRECSFGVFEQKTWDQIRKEVTFEELKEAYESTPDYRPCYNCKEYQSNKWGAVWLRKIPQTSPLSVQKAKKEFEKLFIKTPRPLMLSTHANGTLSLSKIDTILDNWERKDGFVPDVVVIDYADLLITDYRMEERHRQNEIWKGLRRMSQERNCLVITVTQADAASYDTDTLKLKNFSEDKRKYAHVTAMYGLNQDKTGREKKIGIMRINPLLLREDDFEIGGCVYVLQNLRRGQPCLQSYF